MKILNKEKMKSNINNNAKEVPILNIGTMRQSLIMEGRVIPCIVLDTSNRQDIESVILSHKDINNGIAQTTWVLNKKNKNEVILIINFTDPYACCFSLNFNMNMYAMAIENIMRYNVMQILSRNLGESDNILMMPGILIEVPSQEAKQFWDLHLINQVEKNFKKNGLSKKMAKKIAYDFVQEQFKQYFYMENK